MLLKRRETLRGAAQPGNAAWAGARLRLATFKFYASHSRTIAQINSNPNPSPESRRCPELITILP